MTLSYADAVAVLYRAALGDFVSERKRLATELKTQGDVAGAKLLVKLPRPSVSAWAVNQLYWCRREEFEALLGLAQRLGRGEREVATTHRDALAKLRHQASHLLESAGHGASEATLRRVSTTLAAIAASGGFDPDPPGALGADRDPPGFEVGLALSTAPTPPKSAAQIELRSARAPLTTKPKQAETPWDKTERAQHALPKPLDPARIAAQREEAARMEAERLEAERKDAALREAEHREAERKEAERKEAARREAERKEAARREAERKEAARREAERREARSRLLAALEIARNQLAQYETTAQRLRESLESAESSVLQAREHLRRLEAELGAHDEGRPELSVKRSSS